MDAHDFLTAVLPRTGVYCVFELPHRRQVFVDTVEAVAATAGGFAAKKLDTYFALASFKEKGTREAGNAQLMRSLFIDIDIDPDEEQGLYTSKREAVVALNTFLQETHLDTLGAPWLVDSGGGVHAYWPLTDDVPIDEWKPVAERLKRAAFACNFKIDMKVTADAARVLRMPGTVNYKQPVPRPAVLKNRGATFELAAIAKLLPVGDGPTNGHPALPMLNIPGTRPIVTGATPSTAVALAHHIDSSFDLLLERSLAGTGCQQVKWYYDHAERSNMEGVWRAMLSIAKCTDEGIDAGRMLSEWHPYDEERLQKKWKELKGPYSCGAIESENPGGCDGCPHRGQITNPLKLGWASVSMPTPATATTPARMPPKGFSFDDGWVLRLADRNDPTSRPMVILKYQFFLEGIMHEEKSHYARFCKIKTTNGTTTTSRIKLPTAATASREKTLPILAEQLVTPEAGAGQHLYNYVCAAVKQVENDGKVLQVPERYGWQPDAGFAFSDRVVYADPKNNYVFASEKLNNMIEGMEPAGTFDNWQRVMKLLCDKGYYEVVTLGLIGFASPLMWWAADNGPSAMVFHATSSASGVGKTLALQLARSVWGNDRLATSPKTSETTILQRASFLGGLPTLIDEVTTKNRESGGTWTPNFCFDFSEGKHKVKGFASGHREQANDRGWRGLAFLTSNSPVLEDMLANRKASGYGEVQRFLEWRTETRLEFTADERAVLKLINGNYGHAGPLFAEWLVKNRDLARKVFDKVMKDWHAEIDAESEERFWVASGTAIITAATLVGPGYANICTINVARVVAFLRTLVEESRGMIMENRRTARDLIISFVNENNGRFVMVGAASKVAAQLGGTSNLLTPLPNTAKGPVFGRIEIDVTPGRIDQYITVEALNKFCSERTKSYRTLKQELAQYAAVREVKMDLFKDTHGPRSPTRCLHISYATAPAPGPKP